MAYKISKEEMIKPSSSAIELSDGLYCCSIVGYMIHKKEPFTDDKDPFDAVRFALQLTDDAGHSKILQTADWRISLAEKSKLFIQLAGWVKAASPTDLWERLEKANFMDADGSLNFDKFLGTHPAIMVKMVASKKDASKQYPDITFAATKKGQEHQIDTGDYAEGGQAVPLWIGEFINPEDVIETSCLEGFEWKRYEKKEEDSEAPKREKIHRQSIKQAEAPAETTAEAPAEPQPSEPVKASSRLQIRKRNVASAQPVESTKDDDDMPF